MPSKNKRRVKVYITQSVGIVREGRNIDNGCVLLFFKGKIEDRY
jgi:hypothetical protein